MRRHLLLTLVLVAALAAAVESATAATPDQYRAKLNGICRSYTPKLKHEETLALKAQAAKNAAADAHALGAYLALLLKQDLAVEAVPVPAALRSTMTPILTKVHVIDLHVKSAVVAAIAGKAAVYRKQILEVARLSKPLPGQFDAAGLRDCGSNQS